jgi:hypothetical protein
MRLLLAALVLLTAVTAREAAACECVARTFAAHAKAETRVMLARAGKRDTKGDALKQTFTVLATFKGPKTTEFVLDRPATPPCASNYADGEVAILFTSGGDLDPCHGNTPFAEQAPELLAILAATKVAQKPADLAVFEVALRTALAPYLHARAEIPIQHAALAGKTFQIDKSKLVFRKKASPDAIKIDKAIVAGDVGFIRGRYAREGVTFTVITHAGVVIGEWVTER